MLDGRQVAVTGIAKGAGMIKPSMATMLGFVATDTPRSSPRCCRRWCAMSPTSPSTA